MQPNDKEEKWELPPQLRIDNPDILAESEAMRAELAAKVSSPFANLSPHEHARANASIIVEDLRKAFFDINKQISFVLKQGKDRLGQLPKLYDARLAISARMAEAYAALGRYDLAAERATDPNVRAEYVEILEAINRGDDEWSCQCGPENDFVKAEVFSLKHGRMMPMRKCNKCGEVNVTALPAHIAEQRANRARMRTLLTGKTLEEAKAILIAANHTEKLLKE